MIRRFALPLLGSIAFGAGTASAQTAEPSLPVPMPIEERMELPAEGQYYSVAKNGVSPRPFDARAAASRSGISSKPIDRTRVETNLRTLPPGENGYFIKAGAFRQFDNASRLHASLFSVGSAQIIHRVAAGQDYYGVYLGPWKSHAEAEAAYKLAVDAGMQDGKIVTSDAVR